MEEENLENIMMLESKELKEIEMQIERLEREHIRVLQELLQLEKKSSKSV